MMASRKKKTDNECDDFKEGDLVAVFGGDHEKDSCSADRVSLCDVVVVGLADMIVEDREVRFGQSHFRVPKSICTKLDLDPLILSSARSLEPKIGDLVLSYSYNYADKEPAVVTGILYKVTYKLGKPQTCMLLCGTDMVKVNYEDLLVLDD